MNWLDHGRTLREQGIDDNETLLLRRKFFYSDQNVDSRDPVQLNLLYVQVQQCCPVTTHQVFGQEQPWGISGAWLAPLCQHRSHQMWKGAEQTAVSSLPIQARDDILNGSHPVSFDKACEFAGYQCQIQFGPHNEQKHKPGFLE